MSVNISTSGAKTLKMITNSDNSTAECLVKKTLGHTARSLASPIQTLSKLVTPPRVWNTGLELLASNDTTFSNRHIFLENCHNAVVIFLEYIYTGASTDTFLHNEAGNLLRAYG